MRYGNGTACLVHGYLTVTVAGELSSCICTSCWHELWQHWRISRHHKKYLCVNLCVINGPRLRLTSRIWIPHRSSCIRDHKPPLKFLWFCGCGLSQQPSFAARPPPPLSFSLTWVAWGRGADVLRGHDGGSKTFRWR